MYIAENSLCIPEFDPRAWKISQCMFELQWEQYSLLICAVFLEDACLISRIYLNATLSRVRESLCNYLLRGWIIKTLALPQYELKYIQARSRLAPGCCERWLGIVGAGLVST